MPDVSTRRRLSFILAALLVPAACGGTATEPRGSAAPTPSFAPSSADPASGVATAAGRSTVEVDLRLVAFVPATVDVPAGTTVRWMQRDPGAHTVTSGTVTDIAGGVEADPDGTFDSERLEPGAHFEFTPSAAGRISYFCSIHPATMRGVVDVR